jgi:monoamine oxidase
VADWAAEEWSLGGMIAQFAPGVLTNYGHALRFPHAPWAMRR